jgi:hypothetical protein
MRDWFIKLGISAIIILLVLNLFLPARSIRSAQRFQYKAVTINDPNQVESMLNQIGTDGWEFIFCVNTSGLFIFKR